MKPKRTFLGMCEGAYVEALLISRNVYKQLNIAKKFWKEFDKNFPEHTP